MKVYYRGVGDAQKISQIREQPHCPRIGETVEWADQTEYLVKHVTSTPFNNDYDAYCVVAP